MSKKLKQFYEFGPFRIDPSQRVLFREGKPVALPPKVFETLLALVERSGQIVEKEKLIEEVWPDAFVEENNLTQYISALRKTLGDGRHEQRYIETIPRRGYRFAAVVQEVWDEGAEQIIRDQMTVRLKISEETEEVASFFPRAYLRRTILAAATLAVALAGVILWIAIDTKPADTAAGQTPFRGSIAVLPFKALDASHKDEYLGLGMADTLITKLSNIGQIKVRPTSAVRKYATQEQDSLAAGREQNVDAVLEGSIQRSGDKMRVTVRLLSVRDGSPLWAYKCDEVCTDMFEIQDSISEEVAGALMLKLTGQEKERLAKRHTESIEAYQAYLKGRYSWNKSTEEGMKKGIGYFEEAIRIDPNFALAYTGLAHCYNRLGNNGAVLGGLPPREVYPKAKAAALKALEIDEGLGEAYTSLAHVKWNYDRDWVGAESDFKRSLELDPNFAPARHLYAILLAQLGKMDEATAEIKKAQELDPVSVAISTSHGWVFYWGRQYDQAIEQCRKALELDPNFGRAYWIAGLAYRKKGMYREAIAELQKAVTISGDRPAVKAALAQTYAAAGMSREARKLLNELKELSKQSYFSPYLMAAVYAELGQTDQAFALLEKAYEERSAPMISIKGDPIFDSLRSDPRFNELLGRIGLAD